LKPAGWTNAAAPYYGYRLPEARDAGRAAARETPAGPRPLQQRGPIPALARLVLRDDKPCEEAAKLSMRILGIDLDVLTPAERRDLTNALLRAAWSAALENTRILLLDLLLEVDDPAAGGVR
jgi:hypothetical protein